MFILRDPSGEELPDDLSLPQLWDGDHRPLREVQGPERQVPMPRVRVRRSLRWADMGEVALQYRVLPEGLEVDLGELQQKVEQALPEGAQLRAAEKKPVAFGLQALHVLVVLDDKKGGADAVEAAIAGVPGVQSVEVQQMGLL